MSNKELLINNSIEAQEVRLIHEDGRNEVVTLRTALLAATSADLDLVQMNEADVPVCKLMDHARHLYDLKQAEKTQKKKQRAAAITTKEIQLKVDIQENDIKVKQKQVMKFLERGDQVRISLRLHGRARSNRDCQQLALDKVGIFIQGIGYFSVLSPVALAGDTVSVVLKSKAQ